MSAPDPRNCSQACLEVDHAGALCLRGSHVLHNFGTGEIFVSDEPMELFFGGPAERAYIVRPSGTQWANDLLQWSAWEDSLGRRFAFRAHKDGYESRWRSELECLHSEYAMSLSPTDTTSAPFDCTLLLFKVGRRSNPVFWHLDSFGAQSSSWIADCRRMMKSPPFVDLDLGKCSLRSHRGEDDGSAGQDVASVSTTALLALLSSSATAPRGGFGSRPRLALFALCYHLLPRDFSFKFDIREDALSNPSDDSPLGVEVRVVDGQLTLKSEDMQR